ncbi:MAG: methionyl-tRNA formyltransferase [Actinomycetota bacterium]|nr:methionyl-tRNA formyltransferase [Actinomycetota bacterium]
MTPALRVAFLGNAPWSVPSVEALAASTHDLALVATRVPRPAGRGSALTPTAVAEAARGLSLPLAEVETVKRGPGFDRLARAAPDVLVVVAYGEILPPAVLELPRIAPVNLHFSLLPALRGPAPVQRAILGGLTETGVTTMVMAQGVDTGPILLQQAERIEPDDDAGTLGARLAEAGASLLVRTLDLLAAGDLEPRPQEEEAATYAPKLSPEERWIDWSEEPDAVIRRIRALSPDPAASTTFRDRVLKVFRARAAEGSGSPGTVLSAGKAGMLVAAGGGAVMPLEVAPEGRRRMSGEEFVRGYRPREGEVLGARIA